MNQTQLILHDNLLRYAGTDNQAKLVASFQAAQQHLTDWKSRCLDSPQTQHILSDFYASALPQVLGTLITDEKQQQFVRLTQGLSITDPNYYDFNAIDSDQHRPQLISTICSRILQTLKSNIHPSLGLISYFLQRVSPITPITVLSDQIVSESTDILFQVFPKHLDPDEERIFDSSVNLLISVKLTPFSATLKIHVEDLVPEQYERVCACLATTATPTLFSQSTQFSQSLELNPVSNLHETQELSFSSSFSAHYSPPQTLVMQLGKSSSGSVCVNSLILLKQKQSRLSISMVHQPNPDLCSCVEFFHDPHFLGNSTAWNLDSACQPTHFMQTPKDPSLYKKSDVSLLSRAVFGNSTLHALEFSDVLGRPHRPPNEGASSILFTEDSVVTKHCVHGEDVSTELLDRKTMQEHYCDSTDNSNSAGSPVLSKRKL